MNKLSMKYSNVETISKWILYILIFLTFGEFFFFPQIENLYGCFTFIVAWILLSKFVMKHSNVNKCILPFLAMFGLGICYFFMPLLITFMEGKPLTFRFQCPYDTFSYQLINLIMLICAYRLCLSVYKSKNLLTKIWTKIGYFSLPTDKQIWTMGAIGLLCKVLLLLIMGTDDAQSENLGAVGHMMVVMSTFASFPVLLLFKNLLYANKEYKPTPKVWIFIYITIIATLGIATGKRSALFSTFTIMGMCYLLPVFTENRKIFSKKTAIYFFVGFLFITGPLADFTIAMALGRDNTRQTSAEKTFDRIMELYQDKEKLNTMYQMVIAETDNGGDNLSGWSEYYVDNIMMDRFCNLRVCDMTIDYANRLGFDNNSMQEYVKNQLLFLIPTPILKLLGIHINKFDFQYSPGDLISTNVLKLNYQHQGFRVAGDVGIGLLLWGNMYFLYAFLIYFALFYFMSSIVKTSATGFLVFPLPVIAEMFHYLLQFNNSKGIVGVLGIILRTGWQNILMYCVIYYIIRKIIR